jgi:uncharacterized repeat protein (TIGR02543 family)
MRKVSGTILRKKKSSYWFSMLLALMLIASSFSPLPAKAADEILKTTVHTYGSNTWAYSSLAKGPNDELYLAHILNTSEIAIKRWNGTTWESLPSVTTTIAADTEIRGPLNLVADKNGHLHLAFKFNDGTGVTSYRGVKYGFYNRTTNSWSFQEIEAYSDPMGWKNFDEPAIAVDSTGAVHMVYHFANVNEPRNYNIKYATNKSGSWINSTIVSTGSGSDEVYFPQIEIDHNDKVHITYEKEDNQNTYGANVYYTSKNASDNTFPAATKIIDSTGEQKRYLSYPLTLDRNGAVYIPYSDLVSTSYILTNATGTWQREKINVANGRFNEPFSVQFVGSDMYLLLASWNATGSDPYYFAMKKTASGWTVGTKTIAPAEPGIPKEIIYTVDSQGNYMVVMEDVGLRIVSSLSGSSAAFGLAPVVPPDPTYSVTYNGNGQTGGAVPIDTKQYKQGDKVTVLGNVFLLLKTGYSLTGWNTAANGTGTTYPANGSGSFTMPGNSVTLYAQWKPNNYTVTYNPDGGVIGKTTQVKLYDSTYGKGADGITADPMPVPTKSGYTFAGWFTQPNGVGGQINDSTKMSIAANHTLHAKWLLSQYTVSFNVDGGSAVPNQLIAHGGKAVEPTPPTKTGHTFAGWYTDNTFKTVFDFTNNAITSDTTIYAKWTVNQYTVSFNSNGGSAVAPVTTNYNTTITAPTPPTRTGHTFNGWFKEAGLNTAWNFATDKVTQNTTLFAKWTINSYTVNFDVDGGSTVAAQTVNHGDKAVVPTPPTKTGHTFAGWFTDKTYATGFDFANTAITGNTTIYAKWTINQYIVSFISDGGSVVLPISATYNTTITPPAPPTKTGYTFNGWYKDAGLNTAWDFAIDKVTENTTLYAKWTINSYTVSFDVDGGSAVPAQTVNHFDKAVMPTAPTKVGHTFAGWYTDKTYATGYDFNNMIITGPTTIYAKWTINQYTVSFVSNGGSAVAPVTTNYNTTIVAPQTPTREGYTFNGWFKDAGFNDKWDFATDKVTDHTTLYAKWTINSYTVTFDVDGGSAVPPQTVNHFDKAVMPTAPTKVGHTFAGWYTDKTYATGYDFNNMIITGPTTIYAKWTINQYIVSFITDGGSIVLPISATYNTTIPTPAPPTKTGYTFNGWFKDAGFKEVWDFATDKVTDHTTLYAKWTINSYTVTFDADGGTAVPTQTINHFDKAVEPTPPTKTGHTFAGWYTDKTYATGYDFNNRIITGPTTIYAKWTINQYTVSFDSNGGSAVAPVTTNYNTSIAAPPAPTREGYTFNGWFKDAGFNDDWDFATDKVTDHTTLYAKWTINSYTVSFDVDGGSAVPPQTVNHFDKAVMPTAPTKVGHTFAGWYTDKTYATGYDFNNRIITGPTTIYAKWTINQYKVSFDSNGGSAVAPVTTNYGTMISPPMPPTREGHTFHGWYKDTDFTQEWYFATEKVADHTTLHAKWVINKYEVSFDSGIGQSIPIQLIPHGEKVVEPKQPTMAGYTFAGWYKDNKYTKLWDFQKDLVTDSTRLYAKWNIHFYEVHFHTNGGGGVSPILAEYNTTISEPLMSEKPGHQFAGWYRDEGFKTVWNFTTDRVTNTTSLYAKWVLKDQPGTPITEERLVDIETGSLEEGKKVTQIKIKRITETSGKVKDEITLTEESMQTVSGQGLRSARMMLTDPDNKVDEVNLYLPKSVTSLLVTNQIQLELYLNGVRLGIPDTSAQNVGEDLYFHIVPIKGEKERQALLNRVKADDTVKKAAGNRNVELLGTPVEINTNLQGRPVTIKMPLMSTDLPVNEEERQKVLDNLVIYIEHSDGTKEFIKGKFIALKDGSYEMEFSVNKFSTFALVYVDGWKNYANAKIHTAYINGYSDNTFRPNENVTRAQMAAMLMRNLGVSEVASVSEYDDVLVSHWAYKEIMLAKQSGIMMGSGDSFKPNADITRAQMATIIYRWLKEECAKDPNAYGQCSSLAQKGHTSYADVANDYWAAEAIQAIKQFGIMEGYEDGTFKPNALLTRAQAVKVLNRLFKRGPLEGELAPTFKDVPADHWAFKEIEEAVRTHRYIILDGSEIFVGE